MFYRIEVLSSVTNYHFPIIHISTRTIFISTHKNSSFLTRHKKLVWIFINIFLFSVAKNITIVILILILLTVIIIKLLDIVILHIIVEVATLTFKLKRRILFICRRSFYLFCHFPNISMLKEPILISI